MGNSKDILNGDVRRSEPRSMSLKDVHLECGMTS